MLLYFYYFHEKKVVDEIILIEESNLTSFSMFLFNITFHFFWKTTLLTLEEIIDDKKRHRNLRGTFKKKRPEGYKIIYFYCYVRNEN